MIRLTDEQRQELKQTTESPARVVDPETNASYVLLREDVYNRVRILFENVAVSDAEENALLHETGILAGWDDPEMDMYEDHPPLLAKRDIGP